MDTYSYKVIEPAAKSNKDPGLSEDTSIQSANHASDSSLDLRALNLNTTSTSMSLTDKQQRNNATKMLPVSYSSSSIALLNAKSKALKNLKRTEAIFDNDYTPSAFLVESKSTNPGADSNEKMNLVSELNYYSEKGSSITDTYHQLADQESEISDNLDFNSRKEVGNQNKERQKNLAVKAVSKSSFYGYDYGSSHKIDSEKVESEELVQYFPTSASANESQLQRNNSSNNMKAKKMIRGFGLFGRKNRYQTQFSFSTSTQHSSISSRNSHKFPKKINNNIDWSENSKVGIHVWSDHSNPTNDSCYLNEPDVLKFHNIYSEDKCINSSKYVKKKKCNICKIVVHETCVDLLQKNVKCRATYQENITRKKSFREKDNLASQTPISSQFLASPNAHHWICHKFDENTFENRCQTCQKSYTNRFGLQTNRTIISCSWCKQAHHLKCFEDKANLRSEECSFGEHKQLMVPPAWVIKLPNKSSTRSTFMLKSYNRASTLTSIVNSADNHSQLLSPCSLKQQSSLRHSTKAFIIRPPTSGIAQNLSMAKPLLVLINPKSGGKIGPKLLKKFTWLLNARQVFDLSLNPKFPLYLYRNVPNLRVLVGGGDGSVGWVLSVIDQIKFLSSPPSIAVLPLGTGNDLARALHWGGTYNDEPLSKILLKVQESRIVKLDRWKISVLPNLSAKIDSNEKDEQAIDSLKNDVMNNYFSLGADAHIALDFHQKREANPQKFTSRWFNMFQYMESGSKDLIKKTWKDLKDFIQLECDGVSYTDTIRTKGYHCILFLNISRYSGGTNPWGAYQDTNFQVQSMNDGRMEVVGFYTSNLAKVHLGIGGDRICQAKHIKLTTSTYIPIQIDGEPAKLCPSVIELNLKNQANMLEHVKNSTDSPLIAYHSNIIKNFEIKYISLSDYKLYRKEHGKLEATAINVGTICTSNLLDNLSKVRQTINVLLQNCANGFYCSKWSFLSAEEFYKIMDDSDECLLDIVSADEIVYILDESDDKNLDLNKPVETDQNFQSERKPVMQKQKHIIEENNGSDDTINTQSTSVVTNKSVFKIPNSQTQQMITNKSTSSIPSSRSTPFNPQVSSYI